MEHLQQHLSIALAQLSDKGRKPENQDTVGARIPEGSALLTKGIAIAVADGVSSSTSAQQASQAMIKGFLNDYYATPDTWRTQQSAIRVIQSLNHYLWGQSRNNVRGEGYLTTFTCLILKGDKAFIFHVGDTRVYRWRDGMLEQLTRDHSQRISNTESYLSRAIGADLSLEIDFLQEELQAKDLFLLSSDGLHDSLSAKHLGTGLEHAEDLEQLCEQFRQQALDAGSQDNISVQLVRIDSLGLPSQDDAMSVLTRLPFPPLMEPGQQLDGLHIEQILHESERSQVYLVRMPNGRKAVMKTPSVNYQDDPPYIERFVLESWVGSRIQNPHVVRVLPTPQRNYLYYLTEFVQGPTLARLIEERAPVDIGDAIELLEQMIKGTRAFHRKDTLHQDLKPENIVVGTHGIVIIDFGSSRVAGIEELKAPFKRDHILGTLRYSAPEYRCANSVDQRADQFSLAMMLYELITGNMPYGDAYERAAKAGDFAQLRYRKASEHNPMVPGWIDYALEKALRMEPEQRYSSLSEWLQDLKRPNPQWQTQQTQPLLVRHPLRVWQTLAALGWLCSLILLLTRQH